MTAGEIRITSHTGGQKGRKLARFGLIPAGPLRELAELYGRGAAKYSDDNWRRGYDWSLSFDAMMRHAWAFWNGEDIDEETGAKHIMCAVWHGITLAAFMVLHPDFDDRPSTRPSAVSVPRKALWRRAIGLVTRSRA